MAKKEFDLGLRSVEEINKAAEKKSGIDAMLQPDAVTAPGAVNIPISKIDPFSGHPYRVIDDNSMVELAESIKVNGLMIPVVVRKKKGGRYELISGHRRKRACELLGLSEIKAIVQRISDADAAILMVDSNLHREHLLPSEKAWAYRIKSEAMKSKGKRSDLTGEGPYRSGAIIGSAVGDSEKTVANFIRLTYLDRRLLNMVDSGKLKQSAGVDLSYLDKEEQDMVLDVIDDLGVVPSTGQAKKIRTFCRNNPRVESEDFVLMLAKPAKKDIAAIDQKKLLKALPDSVEHGKEEDWIIAAIAHYAAYLENN